MTDSNQPDNQKIRLLAFAWQWVVAIWRAILAMHKAIEEAKKIWGFVVALLCGTGVGIGSLAFLLPASDPPKKQERTIPAAKESAAKEEVPPIALAPLVVEKAKPNCLAVPLSKLHQEILRGGSEPYIQRHYLKRSLCGWHLSVDGSPLRYETRNGAVWRVRFKTKDGVIVIAESERMYAFGDGDIVLAGGVLVDVAINNGIPTVLLQRAWIQRR